MLLSLSVSHKSADVALRERLALDRPALEGLLRELSEQGEALVLSTCNRFEVYLGTQRPENAIRPLLSRLEALGGGELVEGVVERTGDAAVGHLFRVASSLDSMVLGEPQILGQLKDAYELALNVGAARGELAHACQAAFACAKRVRSETGLGRSATSMASAGISLARGLFGSLEGRCVAVIGAGEMATVAARHLASHGPGRLLVTNRTPERASALSARVGGEAVTFDRLPELLTAADVVVSATAAPTPVLTRGLLAPLLRVRRFRQLFVLDLAVPRDVEPSVGRLEGVFVYDVDDVKTVVDENTRKRVNEASRAEELVDEAVARFARERAVRDGVPVLARLRESAYEVARAEAARTLSHLGDALDERSRRSIEAMGMAIVNKLLHAPTQRLRESARDDEAARALSEMAAELFGLPGLGASPEVTQEAGADGPHASLEVELKSVGSTPRSGEDAPPPAAGAETPHETGEERPERLGARAPRLLGGGLL